MQKVIPVSVSNPHKREPSGWDRTQGKRMAHIPYRVHNDMPLSICASYLQQAQAEYDICGSNTAWNAVRDRNKKKQETKKCPPTPRRTKSSIINRRFAYKSGLSMQHDFQHWRESLNTQQAHAREYSAKGIIR